MSRYPRKTNFFCDFRILLKLKDGEFIKGFSYDWRDTSDPLSEHTK